MSYLYHHQMIIKLSSIIKVVVIKQKSVIKDHQKMIV
jgi:hypothetical protein